MSRSAEKMWPFCETSARYVAVVNLKWGLDKNKYESSMGWNGDASQMKTYIKA